MNSSTDILIHLDHAPDGTACQSLLTALRETSGVTRVHLDPARPHLVVIAYEPGKTSSKNLLDIVLGQGHRAQLVGL